LCQWTDTTPSGLKFKKNFSQPHRAIPRKKHEQDWTAESLKGVQISKPAPQKNTDLTWNTGATTNSTTQQINPKNENEDRYMK
jgi:hypothetical protein